MTKPNDIDWNQAKQISSDEASFDGVPGIFVATYEISNMEMDRFIISAEAIDRIVKHTHIPKDLQSQVTADLVDRTPEWVDLEEEVQFQKIIAALTMETVKQFLIHQEHIQKSDMMEMGMDEEKSMILYNYRVQMTREERRKQATDLGRKGREKVRDQINQGFGSQQQEANILELAKARMEGMDKEKGKVLPFKRRK